MKCKRGVCSVLTLVILLVAVCAYGAAHDVAIDQVVVDPGNPRINEPFKIEGVASNLGTEDAHGVEVVFSVNRAETGRVDIRRLKTEASKTVHEFHTFTAPGEYQVAVRAVLEDDENSTNDIDQIIVAAVGDDADDGSSDPPPSDDPPADDPPPDDDDGTGDDGGGDDGFLTAYYHVRVENHTGSAIRFDFSLDSRTYDRSLQLTSGASEVSDTLRVSPGAYTCYGRWQDPATGQWQYEEQDNVIFLFENEEFAFSIESVVRRLEGRVVDGGDPVSNAGVALLEGGTTTVATLRTGRDGRFVFDSLENGRIYSLRITREGYLDKIRELGRITGDLNIGDVTLEAVDNGTGDDEPGGDGDDGIGDDTGDDDPAAPADSDGDGVIDADDAFPGNPAESVDTDGDGIGDNADTDDDGDGMPDSWEIEHRLNPLVVDAAEDPDGDGVTNIDEYAAGTDPGVFEENFPPGIPVLTAPADHAAGLPVAPTLETGGFTDPDSDDHAQTRWQIAERPDFQMPAFDVQSNTFLTRLDVPNLVLPGETTCYWRVRYIDSRGGASPWSETRSFTTRAWAADENRNGIADAVEYTDYSDMDADGVADLDQENIDCVMAVKDQGRVMGVLCPEAAGVIECLEVLDYGDIADEAGRPEQMPFDLINFRLRLPQPGGSVRLRIYLSEPLEGEAAWYKYNPMTGWVDFSSAATFDASGQVVEIEIKDGGEGDIDGVANGVIVDPSGVSAGVGSATIGKDDDDDDDEGGTWYVGCFIRSLNF